jgi:hypothetical protein
MIMNFIFQLIGDYKYQIMTAIFSGLAAVMPAEYQPILGIAASLFGAKVIAHSSAKKEIKAHVEEQGKL